MKHLRQYIRHLLREDAFDFAKETGMLQKSGKMGMWTDNSSPPDKASRRKIKDIFRRHADHEWLANNITTIHWSGEPENLMALAGKGKDEIPTSMSKVGAPVIWHDYGSIGLWVKGHISLAANNMNNIVSGRYSGYGSIEGVEADDMWMHPDRVTPEKFKQQDASSGINRQPKHVEDLSKFGNVPDNEKSRKIFNDKYRDAFPYVLDAETWKEPERFPNEALVDNWRVKGIVLADPDDIKYLLSAVEKSKRQKKTFYPKEMIKLAEKFGVPVFDKNFQVVWTPGE